MDVSCPSVYSSLVRRRIALIAVVVAALAFVGTVSALAISDRSPPRPGIATPTTIRPTTTTIAPAKSPPTTEPVTTSTTPGPASTTTTNTARADSLLYINGINQTTSDISSTIIASCVAGMPSSIEVTVSSLTSKTPTGSIDWSLNEGPDKLFPLTQGSVTIPYQCPATEPPSGSVPVSIFYAGDINFFVSAVTAQLGVLPG